jgi:hypothetical protein
MTLKRRLERLESQQAPQHDYAAIAAELAKLEHKQPTIEEYEKNSRGSPRLCLGGLLS